MNFDTMEAGREMDALVAEKVMGWTKGISDGMPPVWYTLEPDGKWYIHRLCVTWCPSAPDRISDAWEVVEKMHEIFPDYYIDINLLPSGEYVCTLLESAEGAFFHANEQAPTAPLAICRAALMAMEEK